MSLLQRPNDKSSKPKCKEANQSQRKKTTFTWHKENAAHVKGLYIYRNCTLELTSMNPIVHHNHVVNGFLVHV